MTRSFGKAFAAFVALMVIISPRSLFGQSTTLVAAVAVNGTGALIVDAESLSWISTASLARTG